MTPDLTMSRAAYPISFGPTAWVQVAQFDPLDHSVSKIGPSSCTFWLVYALDVSCSFSKTFVVQNDNRAYLNLTIKQQIYM